MMGVVRLLGRLALAAALTSCHTPPHKLAEPRPAASASTGPVIAPEPVVPPVTAFDCDFETPRLAIMPTEWLLDGAPVTEWELQKRLNAKRALRAQIGGAPTREMTVQTVEDVSPAELGKLVQIARSFGYDRITFSTLHPPPARANASGTRSRPSVVRRTIAH